MMLVSLAGPLVISIYAGLEALRLGPPTMLDVQVKGSSPGIEGFTIVQISDVHLGVIVNEKRMRKIVDAINAIHPDLLLITGDLVDENADRLVSLADPLRQVKTKYGVYAITGNHEYYAGAQEVIRHATAWVSGICRTRRSFCPTA